MIVEVHRIVGCDEGGNVGARFGGEERIYFPEVFFASSCAADSFVDITRTAVVGGYGKRPVAVGVVELLEIFCGGFRRAVWVAAFVHKTAYFESFAFGGGHHELPQTGGPGSGDSVRVEGRFDDGKVFQFHGQAVAVEGFFEYRHIVETHAEHGFDKRFLAVAIHVDICAYYIIIWHLDDGGQRLQTVDVVLLGIVFRRTFVGVFVKLDVVGEIPVLHEFVGVGLEAFGIDYFRCGYCIGGNGEDIGGSFACEG